MQKLRIGSPSLALLATVGIGTTLASAQTPAPSFTDVTAGSGIDSTHLPTPFNQSQYSGGGCVGDFTGDGVQEIFLCSGGGADIPDRLYVRSGNSYTDVAASWGLTDVHNGKGMAVGDYDDDGDVDLFVSSAGPPGSPQPGHHKLYQNNGNGTFTNVAAAAGVDFTSTNVEDGWGCAFGDYDLDGDLDLFVSGITAGNNGSRIFRNDDDGTFTDVTDQIGLFSGTPGVFAFAPRFADMDGDRYPELLMVGDFGTTRYFRNNANGTFSDITNQTGAAQEENGMGQCVGDWNNDGLLDWYVTSILLPSANWTGNKQYFNQGNHFFTEESASRQTSDGGYGWGSVAVDFNHDGLTDIAEVNGDNSFGSTFQNEPAYLFMQVQGQAAYNEMAAQSGFVHSALGRGMLNFDMDNDGDQDLLVISIASQAKLYRNEIAGLPNANWLRLFFDTSTNVDLAPQGYGTKTTITVGGSMQSRHLVGGDNYLSVSELSSHFGVGSASVIDEVKIEWADGQTTILTNVAANQTLTVVAPDEISDPMIFCTGKISSSGCLGAIAFSGQPSMTSGLNFDLSASNVDANKPGILFYGFGEAAIPFLGGTLCSQPPLRRTGLQFSAGAGGCSGTYTFDFNSLVQGPSLDPFIMEGSHLAAQYWYRDPGDAFGSALSNAVNFDMAP